MPSPNFTDLVDLASQRLGGAVIAANDEFFAPKESLVRPGKPERRDDVFTERGMWMDGWETRRRRTPGHDWAIVRLGAPGIVRGIVIDTSFFTGNFPEKASVEACALGDNASVEGILSGAVHWDSLLPQSTLAGDTANLFAVEGQRRRVTHVRLNIFPDGGVARLRVHGEVVPDADVFSREADLAAMENGAFVVACSDMHYGDRQNLILPGRAMNMGDGWQTQRRRGPGHDWSIIRLARRGTINRIELDTDHFKGNAPGKCMIEYADAGDGSFDPDRAEWHELLPETPLEPDARHKWYEFDSHPATHVRLNIHPDGGVARLRLFGTA
jgi:allantoicase